MSARPAHPAAQPLLPDPDALTLDAIMVQEGTIVFHVRTTTEVVICPECGCRSERAHSRYQRTLQDLPWQGNAVRFRLTVRRFFCDNRECPRRIFAEAINVTARRYGRKTVRLEDVLLQLTWRIGGASAARIARLIGLLLSPDALLYRFKKSAAAQTPQECPEVLGIDDFAFRRGHRYGTILIDLKTSTPVDLLPDRERATVEKWLRDHPGARIVSRDRSSSYADAIREGVPEAVHVADRFHLLKNLMEALQTQIGKESKAIREVLVPKTAAWEDAGPVNQARHVQRAREESRQRRLERWQKCHDLFNQGFFKKEIARMTNLDVRTVRTYLRASTFPERQRYPPVNSPLTPYKEYLLRRWEQGCQNALQLWREVKQQGYPGAATSVREFVVPLRKPGMTPAVQRAERSVPTPRALSWMLVLPERRTPEQTQLVEKLCPACPALSRGRDLVLSFQDMLRRRAAEELDGWLESAKGSGLCAFATFARGIAADRAAVTGAFSLPWSNGPTEGHVNRLKFIKRQGYGRASFELLKRRVLPLPA